LLQKRKNKSSDAIFIRQLKGQAGTPLKPVTDKLQSYSAAKKN